MQGTLKHHAAEAHGFNPWASPAHPRQRGIAMLLVLIAVAIATVLSMSFLASQATTHGVSQNVQKHAQARSIAESALVAAIQYAQTDANFRSDKTHGQWASDVSFNGGTFDLYGYDGLDTDGDGVIDDTDGDLADDAMDPVTLTAIGFFDGVSHTVHAVVTPGGAELEVLFVVGDASSLTVQDQDKIDLMEGWGMTVTLISDGDSQAAFDAAAALADVAYIAGSVDPGAVGSKLTSTSIGVVSDEGGGHDDLLITDSDGGTYSDQDIDIVNNTHFITGTIAYDDMDDLSITTGNEDLAVINGTLAPGAMILATRKSTLEPTLVAFNAGGELSDGSLAAGRRVLLPWGNNNTDITKLTDEGKTILERSLRWAGQDYPTVHTYDFATRTQGTNIWAYAGQESANPPANNTSPSAVLNSAEYDTIEADDSGEFGFATSSNGKRAVMRYVIRIDQDETDVAQLDVTWIGRNINEHGPRADGAILYIWNYTSGGYEQIDISADTELEVSLAGTVGSNLADYLGGAGDDTVILLAMSRDRQTGNRDNTLYCDYVSLTVSTGGGNTSGPQLIALYEFQEVPIMPALIGHWPLDDPTPVRDALYDFDTRTPDTDIWAYGGQSSSSPPSVNTTPASSLNAVEHLLIQTDDALSHAVFTATNNDRPQMRYVIRIDEDPELVELIDVRWIGSNRNVQNSAVDGMILYLWNYTTGQYDQIAVSADTEAEVTLSAVIASTPDDYLGGVNNDTITLFAQSRDKRSGNKDNDLYNDYVSVTIDERIIVTDTITGNDGSVVDEAAPEAAGNGDGGTAYDFDGVDDYVLVPHDDTYLLDDGSLSFWFNSDDLSGHRGLVSKDSLNLDTGGHLHVYTDGSVLKARIQSTAASYEVQASGLTTGTWYHVVVSWGSSGFKLFVNGVQRDSDAYTGGLGTSSGGAGNYEPLVFGASTWNSGDLVATPIFFPFDGRIDDVRFYDQGFNATQADNVYNGNEPGGGLARYVYDTSAYRTPLDLDIEEPGFVSWGVGGWLTINTATRVSSPSAATKLYDALTATNQMSVEVVFSPSNTTQSGPARIVSYSGGAGTRNFTFGQDADAYTARLRTATTTSNGTPDADSGSVLTAGEQTHVILSYDGTNITMYRDGGATTTLARTGGLNWDNTFRFMFGDEITGGSDWLGGLHRVAIYDRAFTEAQAANVFNGDPPGTGGSGTGGVDWIEP